MNILLPSAFFISLIILMANGQLLPELILDAYYKLAYNSESREKGCRKWFTNDLGTARLHLPPCPPTTELANADKNFTRDGFWSDNAFYHPGADFCARAKNTNSSAGGRQQCCYKGANILLGPPGGGTEDARGDQFGHIREDIHPWFLCCRGQSNQTKADELCQLYYRKRPSNDGKDYRK